MLIPSEIKLYPIAAGGVREEIQAWSAPSELFAKGRKNRDRFSLLMKNRIDPEYVFFVNRFSYEHIFFDKRRVSATSSALGLSYVGGTVVALGIICRRYRRYLSRPRAD